MRSGGPLRRRGPIRRRNPERMAKRRAAQFGPQAALCRRLPCSACERPPPSDPAHIRTRASMIGEPLSKVDRGNVIPLCRICHTEQGTIGIPRFEAKWNISMEAIAARLAVRVYGEEPAP